MAQFDIESACHDVPVHSDDRFPFGMKWQGKYLIDLAVPFGLPSAPFLLSSIANILDWILNHHYGLNIMLHLLDDFHTLRSPNLAYMSEQY